MTRLYRAHSILDNFCGCDDVRIDWFVRDRQAPPAPYEEVIANYHELGVGESSPERCFERGYTQACIDELFTAAEIEELRAYLAEAHETELFVEEVELPIEGPMVPTGGLSIAGMTGSIPLVTEAGYNLSIRVWGYYDLRLCWETVSTPPAKRQLGGQFVACVLREAEGREWAEWPPSAEELEEIAESIYDSEGLFVEQGKTKAERLEGRAEYERRKRKREREREAELAEWDAAGLPL